MLLSTCVLLWLLVAAPAFASRNSEGLNILGGEDVAANDLNFVAGLIIRRKNARTYATCTGSIINERWILTAGHCIEGANPSTHVVEVSVGTKTLSQGPVIQAEKWIQHERYRQSDNPTTVYFDIALIKLEQPITGIANTEIYKLPSQNEFGPRAGSIVTVVGFGIEGEGALATSRRGIMKKADMRILGLCRNTFPYCISAREASGRACPGDSGGPMIYQGKVVGVSSTGTYCTTRSGDAQYTKVSRYINWINNKINQG